MRVLASVFLLGVLSGGPTWLLAQPAVAPAAPGANAQETLSLDDLIRMAIQNNPALEAAKRRVETARLRVDQERALPDAMLSVGYNSSGNPLPGAGLGVEPTANIGAMVTQPIPYAGKRDLRAAVAAREADVEAVDEEAARLDLTARVKEGYYRLAYVTSAEHVLTHHKELLETLLGVAETRYSVGRATQQDVFRAQAELTMLELRIERLDQERQTREAQLNALLNRPPGTPLGRPRAMEPHPFDVALETVIASAIAHSPVLRREQAVLARNESAVEVAKRDFKPDFALSGGYYYMGSMPAMYTVRFDVQLPFQRARRQLALSERSSAVAESRATYDAARRDVEARVQGEYHAAVTTARLVRLYGETMLPQVRLTFESAMASYETGTVDFMSLHASVGSVLENELNYIEALTEFHAAASRLEAMTGEPIAH